MTNPTMSLLPAAPLLDAYFCDKCGRQAFVWSAEGHWYGEDRSPRTLWCDGRVQGVRYVCLRDVIEWMAARFNIADTESVIVADFKRDFGVPNDR